MKRIFLCSQIIFFICTSSFAQLNIDWQKSFGGSSTESGTQMAKTLDGGYVIAGVTWSNNGDITGYHDGGDFWVVKVDKNGDVEWQRALGGSGFERATDVVQTKDGGYLLAGESQSNNGDVSGHHGSPESNNSNFWVVKLDNSGHISWQKSLGGSEDEVANSIIEATDGGYIVAGGSYSDDGDVSVNNGKSDIWVVKLDNLGTIVWERSYGGRSYEQARAIIQTNDGEYLLLGIQNHDFWFVKINDVGMVSWQKSYGGSTLEQPQAVIQTHDGGFLAVGDSNSKDGDVTGNHGGQEFWVVKVDSLGDLIWQASYGGSNGDNAYDITPKSDGSYIIAGTSSSSDGQVTHNQGSYDYWVIKIDPLGNLIWQKSFGGSEADISYAIHTTDLGEYVLAGESESDNGDVLDNRGDRDFWIVKLDSSTVVSYEGTNHPLFSIHPNPTRDYIYIYFQHSNIANIAITDARGKIVFEKISKTPFEKIDLTHLPNGPYFINVRSDHFSRTKKVIKH